MDSAILGFTAFQCTVRVQTHEISPYNDSIGHGFCHGRTQSRRATSFRARRLGQGQNSHGYSPGKKSLRVRRGFLTTTESGSDYAPAQDLLLSAMGLIGVKYKWGEHAGIRVGLRIRTLCVSELAQYCSAPHLTEHESNGRHH